MKSSRKFIQPASGIRTVRDEVREHLASIVSQAGLANRMALKNDNLCEVLDAMDNELQEVIRLVERVRGVTS